jgi:putative transposase
LTAAESDELVDLNARLTIPALIQTLLDDMPRAGRPPTFTAEQLAQLIALACTPPAEVGCPVTHWTPRELALELQRQQIIPSISPRSVGRFLKGVRPQAPSHPVLAQ